MVTFSLLRRIPDKAKHELIGILFILQLGSVFLVSAHAQEAGGGKSFAFLKGRVVDSATGIGLGQVSVEVHQMGQTGRITRALTDDSGYFRLKGYLKGPYELFFSSVGYKAAILQVAHLPSGSVNLGSIILAPIIRQLKEIQVITRKPLIEQDGDKLTYNLEADPGVKSVTAFDILGRVPMLSFDAEDNLQMNGSGNFRLLVNGKNSSLFVRNQSEVLKYFPASFIKAIEVITVPPSKYEVQGVGGIINIITYRDITGGYNGGFSAQVSSHESFSGNSNFAAKWGKISLSGNFGYNTSVSPTSRNTFFREDKITLGRLEQNGTGTGSRTFQTTGGEASFELNNLNLITVSYSINKGKSESDLNQEVILFNADGLMTESYHRMNTGKNRQHGNDLVVDYQRIFKKNEVQRLTFSYKKSSSTNSNASDFSFQPLVGGKVNASNTNNDDEFGEQSFQADYVQPIQLHTLELGCNSTQRKNSSDYFYKILDSSTGIFVVDTNQSNTFSYIEGFLAAYTSLNLVLGKWGLRSGVRVERANVDAHFVSSGTTASRKYLNFIPAITLSRKFKGIRMLRLSYTQRINRPGLDYLNPYIDLTDPWNISYGNPGLRPELSHVFQLTYNTSVRKTFISLSAFHQFSHNSILQYTVLGPDTVARTTVGNIGWSKSYNLSFGMNTTLFKNLSLNLNSAANHIQFAHRLGSKPYDYKGLTYHISSALTFRKNGWRMGCNANYNAPNVLSQGKSAGYFFNSLSVSNTFLKHQQAMIRVLINSPFQKSRGTYTEIRDPAFYQIRASHSTIRTWNLFLSYRLGKVQAGPRG